jgi:hypothetical protein
MRRLGTVFVVACLAGAMGASCSISDVDRCPSGFIYQPENMTCKVVPDASAAGDQDAAPPSISADAQALAGEAGGPSFGSICATTSECASSATNYCVLLPGSASGYCSKANCSNECPSDYKCCNCPAIALVVCLTSADSTLAIAAFGCTCS